MSTFKKLDALREQALADITEIIDHYETDHPVSRPIALAEINNTLRALVVNAGMVGAWR